MRNQAVPESRVHEAIDTMIQIPAPLAEAIKSRVVLEEMKKAVIGALILASDKKTSAEKEAWAYSQPEYKTYVDKLGIAVQREQELRWKAKAAETEIDLYRTESANVRKQNL